MTIRNEGVLSLYRGMSPTVVGIAPYVGLNFMVFESLRQSAPKGIIISFISGNTI